MSYHLSDRPTDTSQYLLLKDQRREQYHLDTVLRNATVPSGSKVQAEEESQVTKMMVQGHVTELPEDIVKTTQSNLKGTQLRYKSKSHFVLQLELLNHSGTRQSYMSL